jgi:hypothetical protein
VASLPDYGRREPRFKLARKRARRVDQDLAAAPASAQGSNSSLAHHASSRMLAEEFGHVLQMPFSFAPGSSSFGLT